MLSGPSTILELQKEDALTDWRALIGPMIDAKENAPDSLRAKFQVGDVNPIHAASNQTQVKLEADLFFENQDGAQKESAVSVFLFVDLGLFYVQPAAEEPQAAPEVNAEEAPVEAEATEVPAESEAPAAEPEAPAE